MARKARRGRGEGSLYYSKASGLWVGTVDLGMVDGRRQRRSVTSKDKATARAKMAELVKASGQGLPVPDQTTTTADWLNWWLAEVLPGTVKASTETSYRWMVENYVIPHVGGVRLAQLGPEHVQRMMRALERKGLSPRTRAYARTVLRQALGQAERWGKVARNAAALVDPPRKAAARLDDAMDADEAAAVLDAARGDRLEALAVLVLAVGLRRGEALALRWDDVDLEAGTLTVAESKTDAGRRTVALPPFVVAALKGHHRRQLEERMAATYWHDDGVVFASAVGTPLLGRTVLAWWHDLTVRAGVGRRRFMASRHTAATLMLNNGVPLEVVSATLGHAGLAITADVYAKVRPQLQRKAADAMETVLGGGR